MSTVNLNRFYPFFSIFHLATFFFDLLHIQNGLVRLKGNKSIGPDSISGDFLYAIRFSLCFPIWSLFRKPLDSGIFHRNTEN